MTTMGRGRGRATTTGGGGAGEVADRPVLGQGVRVGQKQQQQQQVVLFSTSGRVVSGFRAAPLADSCYQLSRRENQQGRPEKNIREIQPIVFFFSRILILLLHDRWKMVGRIHIYAAKMRDL